MTDAALERFRTLVERPDEAIDLAEAALAIAQQDYPDLEPPRYLDMLGAIEDYLKRGRTGADCDWRGFKVYCGPAGFPFQPDRLYLSNGPDPKTGEWGQKTQ